MHQSVTWHSDSRAVSAGSRVYVCCSEEDMGDDPIEWYLSRLEELCAEVRNRTELRC